MKTANKFIYGKRIRASLNTFINLQSGINYRNTKEQKLLKQASNKLILNFKKLLEFNDSELENKFRGNRENTLLLKMVWTVNNLNKTISYLEN